MQQQLTKGTFLHGGTYKIEHVLGQGSFGITYLAIHTALDKKVAIKEFFMKELNGRGEDGSITGMSDGSLSQNYAQKFKKEALNLARLEHPNIVRVTDSFEDNGTIYYVMDYIEGQNLNDYVKTHHLSQQEAVDIIQNVAEALRYMHEEKHMLHLDLKPGNVMRRASDGHIFLIDFGLSKHYSNDGQPETSTTIGLGTAGYAPIEQANQAKNGEFRPTIDVYALGATLYKLLTRETPPAASELVSDDELLAENLRKHNVSTNLAEVVIKAMLPNVRKRTQTIKAFIDTLSVSSSSGNSTVSSPSKDSKEMQVFVDEVKSEETIVKTSKISHLDFEEQTYKLEDKFVHFPTSTLNKANAGDVDAMIAYAFMCLRGKGHPRHVQMAYSWFKTAKEAGDDRGAKMIDQWETIKEKYNPQIATSAHKTQKSDSPIEKSSTQTGCAQFLIVLVIIAMVAIGIWLTKGCENTVIAPAPVGEDTAWIDSTVADTVAITETQKVSDIIEEIGSHKTKGGWRHSGTVITNYTETSGLTVCKSKIDKNNACKNGCLIGAGRGVVVIGKNSYACEGIPENIKSVLENYKSIGSRINDIAITPQNKYVVIEENNGFSNNTGIPELDKELNRANAARETIYSVALSDNGNWAVITDQHYTSVGYFDEIERARKKYGEVNSVSMTNKGVVICCRKGVYYKNIPKRLADDLDQLYWIPKYIKFTDGGIYLITDGKSAYWYLM